MNSKNLDGITRRFREWRSTMGLTLEEVQQAVNRYLPEERQVGRSTVNNYEARNPPPATFIAALKKAYPGEVDLKWFLFGEDVPDEDESSEGDLLYSVAGRETDEATATFGVAAGVVDEMATDLILSYPEYRFGDSVYQDLDEPSEKMANLYEALGRIFSAPFEAPRHFVTLDEMTGSEVRNYAYALLGAVRPLMRVVRDDPRPARPVTGEANREKKQKKG